LKGEITRRVKLIWLPLNNQLLAVITLSCSEVLLLLLGIQAITHEMSGLLTIVTQVGWQASVLGNLLLIFLDEAELLLHESPPTTSACRLVPSAARDGDKGEPWPPLKATVDGRSRRPWPGTLGINSKLDSLIRASNQKIRGSNCWSSRAGPSSLTQG
jgi:hypothetical protein